MMLRIVLAFALIAAAVSTSAALESASRFDRDFNREAKAANIQHRARGADCNAATCEFNLTPTGRMSVVFDGPQKKVDEVAFYFPPEARSGADVIDILGAVLNLFSKDQPKATREGVRLRLVEQAAGRARDGEFKLGRWTYVLRPNDGRDVRLYVRATGR